MIVDKLQDTLNGGYNGLYGEVVQADCYKLKQLKFVPDCIFDMGANVGVFTNYARSLFPDATIIAIEPDKDNFINLETFLSTGRNTYTINMAIGIGDVYRVKGRINGAHESYLNEVNGEPSEKTNIKCMMPDYLISMYLREGMKSLLKLDIESNETVIWEHEPSMQALKKIDYFTGEIHYTMLSGKAAEESKQKSLTALHSLDDTHNVVIEGTSFWCTKK